MREECTKAFMELKEYLGKPPLVCNPVEGKTLYIHLVAANFAVAAKMVREKDKVQSPIYYVSKTLTKNSLRVGGCCEKT